MSHTCVIFYLQKDEHDKHSLLSMAEISHTSYTYWIEVRVLSYAMLRTAALLSKLLNLSHIKLISNYELSSTICAILC